MSDNYWRRKYRSWRYKSNGVRSQQRPPKSIFPDLKWSIIWIIIHSFSVWLVSYFLVVISNEFLYLILAGLGITIISKMMRTITRHASFRVDKNFVFWFCITTFSFWIVRVMLQYVQIQSGTLYYILMGCGIFVIGQIVQKIR